MIWLRPKDLPTRSNGFLQVPKITRDQGGARVTSRFDLSRFDEGLFEQLGLPLPEVLQKALPKRKAEFLAGRAMAATAQAAQGLPVAPLPISPAFTPLWPIGQAGSISHARGFCASFVLPAEKGSPGIDIEAIATPNALKAIEAKALHGADTAHLAASNLPPEVAATLLFSAKETLYKALWPTVQYFFGFTCAELTAPIAPNTLALRLTETLHPTLPQNTRFTIHHNIAQDHVLTWMRSTP